MSTVNGKSLREVLNELRQYKKPLHKTRDGYGYFKTEEIISAFDEIVGFANYNVEYTDYKYTSTSAGQEMFSVKCIITIIDDDGKPVLKRECYGTCECKYSKDTSKVVNLQNSSDFVCSYAFKNAAKRFGVFGLKTGERAGDEPVTAEDNKSSVKAQPDTTASVMNFITSGAFEQVGDRNGRPVYKISAYEVVDASKCREKVSQIIFYPNQYSKSEKITKNFNEYLTTCKEKQRRLRINTKQVGEDNGITQYVFLGFASA